MATIENTITKKTIYLNSQHIFGRSPHSSTQLNAKDVSKSHATLYWQGGLWHIKDHSRNGTAVNGNFLHNSIERLAKGQVINFGKDPATHWKVLDIAPPLNYLELLAPEQTIIPLEAYYALPNEENPEIAFFCTPDRQWKAERAGETLELEHHQVFVCNGQEWRFVRNELVDETVDYGRIKQHAWFEFTLSTDQEKIDIKITVNELVMDLGEHTYNYLLLALARKRLEDIEAGYELKDQGWQSTENLTKELTKDEMKDVDQYNLNLRIHRIRKDLQKLKPHGSQFVNVIERRKGEIRFGHPKIKIQ